MDSNNKDKIDKNDSGINNADFNAAQQAIKLHQDQIEDLQKQVNDRNAEILKYQAANLTLKSQNQILNDRLKTAETLNVTFKANDNNQNDNYQEADLKSIKI